MPVPLPLTLHGPVTGLSPHVRVTGVLQGAKVEIFDGDTQLGSKIAEIDGENYIPLDGDLIGQAKSLTGIQTTSEGTSERSRYEVQVQKVTLESPLVSSLLHTCVTDILCEGLLPGATLITLLNGNKIGERQITYDRDFCGISDPELVLPEGALVEIYQTTTLNGEEMSGPSPDLPPISPFPQRYKTLPPGNLAPAKECNTRIDIFNLVPGAMTDIDNEGQTTTVLNTTANIWFKLGFGLKRGNITMQQRLPRCIKDPGPAWTDRVTPIDFVPAPFLNHEICEKVLRITASKLVPPGNLYIIHVQSGDGLPPEGKLTHLERRPFTEVSETVDLPSDTITRSPGGSVGFVVRQEHCGISSADSYKGMQGGGNPTDGGPPRFVAELYECGDAIALENVFPGTNLEVFGDDGAISEVRQSAQLTITIRVYPRLKKGKVIVRQTGCGQDAEIAARVNAIPNPLPTPGLAAPVKPGDLNVFLKGVLAGAMVYIILKSPGSPSEQIQSIPVRIYDPKNAVIGLSRKLAYKDSLVAVQALCESRSNPAANETVVTFAKFKISGLPSQATRGSPISFTITASDSATGENVAGTVSIDGSEAGSTGQNIVYSPGLNAPNPTIVVSAGEAYESVTATIPLVDPIQEWTVSLKASPVPASIRINIDTSIPVNIANLVWTITPTWDPSKQQVRRPYVNNPSPATGITISSSVTLPIPTGSNKMITAELSGDALALWPTGASVAPIIAPVVNHFYSGNNSVSLGWLFTGAVIFDENLNGYYVINAAAGA